jgi:hypothetical protein
MPLSSVDISGHDIRFHFVNLDILGRESMSDGIDHLKELHCAITIALECSRHHSPERRMSVLRSVLANTG